MFELSKINLGPEIQAQQNENNLSIGAYKVRFSV